MLDSKRSGISESLLDLGQLVGKHGVNEFLRSHHLVICLPLKSGQKPQSFTLVGSVFRRGERTRRRPPHSALRSAVLKHSLSDNALVRYYVRDGVLRTPNLSSSFTMRRYFRQNSTALLDSSYGLSVNVLRDTDVALNALNRPLFGLKSLIFSPASVPCAVAVCVPRRTGWSKIFLTMICSI